MGRQIKIDTQGKGTVTSVEVDGVRIEIAAEIPAVALAEAAPQAQYIYSPLALKVGADGKRAPDGAKDHVAVLYPYYAEPHGLLIDARRPIESTVRDSAASIAKQSLFGKPLQLLDDVQTQLTTDRDYREPAVNPDLYPNTPSTGWLITSKPYLNSDRSPSGCVWAVNLHYGYVLCVGPGSNGFVRGGRLVPASQVLGFLAGGSL